MRSGLNIEYYIPEKGISYFYEGNEVYKLKPGEIASNNKNKLEIVVEKGGILNIIGIKHEERVIPIAQSLKLEKISPKLKPFVPVTA